MSGLYNMVFQTRPYAPALMALLAYVQDTEFGRQRDAWVEIDGDWMSIRVLTRNGGGNRKGQAAAIASMRAHPWFDRDADQTFDSTYADFWFLPPLDLQFAGELAGRENEILAFLTGLAESPVDMDQRWKDAIKDLETNGPPASMAPLVDQLTTAFEQMGVAAREDQGAPKDASSG